jgi:pimeloyl-ACP methyl ester carboxylesterase
VLALDQRGHGRSQRHPGDVSRSAYVEDAAALAAELGGRFGLVIGQSLGGHTAFLLAARHPELVERLVVVEAGAGGPDEDAPDRIRKALESWPVPFPTRAAAIEFFGGDTPRARAWADGLDERDNGLWPLFDLDVAVAALDELATGSYWNEWERIDCPTLLVRGEHGELSVEEAARMEKAVGSVTLREIPGAGHDVHLDSPSEWRDGVARFLDG